MNVLFVGMQHAQPLERGKPGTFRHDSKIPDDAEYYDLIGCHCLTVVLIEPPYCWLFQLAEFDL
eukprot:scaffold618415_cov20-Prasinocladus_malaysianus.AAC.1